VVEDFLVLGKVEGVGGEGLVADGREDEVKEEEEEDVERLAAGGDLAEVEGEGAGVVCADGGGVDEVWLYLV